MWRLNNPAGLDIYETIANSELSKPAIKCNPGKEEWRLL